MVWIIEHVFEEVDGIEYLSLLIDNKLTWNSHTESVCHKIASGLFALKKFLKCIIFNLKSQFISH